MGYSMMNGVIKLNVFFAKKETTVKSTEEQAIIAWNNILWSNEKPKMSGVYNVLYRTDKGNFVTSCYFDGTDTWYHDVGINHDRVCTDKVIMWQPLPEMPKDDAQNDHRQHTKLLEELRYYKNLLRRYTTEDVVRECKNVVE